MGVSAHKEQEEEKGKGILAQAYALQNLGEAITNNQVGNLCKEGNILCELLKISGNKYVPHKTKEGVG
ncbi:MAG: hypothetical protein N3G76_02855 [Candidatus Micrarchaeota archaeon]|nr:hypothetical protein [Candidatus Micrarchaeota archaeon]